jgi:hypothetical protein
MKLQTPKDDTYQCDKLKFAQAAYMKHCEGIARIIAGAAASDGRYRFKTKEDIKMYLELVGAKTTPE